MQLLAVKFWDKLVEMDQWLFVKINSEWSNPVFDILLPFFRNGSNWAPLYLFFLVFILLNFKTKGIWWVVFFISTVALIDITGNYVFKHGFERLRPCNDPGFHMQVRLLLDHCGVGYSFTSNHAANHFGMAAFMVITLRHILKKWIWLAFIWAAAISYAQVYVGVHYPLDVICGALLGLAFGITMGSIFNKRFGFAIFDNQPTA